MKEWNILRSKMFFVLVIIFVLLAAGSIGLLGWYGPRKSWEESTGWNRINPALKPDQHEPTDREPWIRWLGHSGFIIRWHGTTLLLDPNVSDHCTVSKRIMEFPPLFDTMGPVNVLISHAHFDHLNQDTLVMIPEIESILIPDGSEIFLNRIDRESTAISPVHKGKYYQVGNLLVTPVRAAHNGNRFHPLRSKFDAYGYMIQAPDGMTVYYAGDTAYDNGWKEFREKYHPDIAILPIGAYAPRIPLKYHHLNPEEAALVASELGVKKVIPCHFGTFTLSFDRPASALPRFAKAIKEQDVPWEMPQFLSERDVEIMAADAADGRDDRKKNNES